MWISKIYELYININNKFILHMNLIQLLKKIIFFIKICERQQYILSIKNSI